MIIVVFKIGIEVVDIAVTNAFSFESPLLILKLYALNIWVESSTINPKTIANTNTLDKLK